MLSHRERAAHAARRQRANRLLLKRSGRANGLEQDPIGGVLGNKSMRAGAHGRAQALLGIVDRQDDDPHPLTFAP